MTYLPKPRYCGQDWTKMTPTEGGRICQACRKRIVNFSKMDWDEIEKIQSENQYSVCGMYSSRQLKEWGVYPQENSASKIMALLALAGSLHLGTVTAQNTPPADSVTAQVILTGVITSENKEHDTDTLTWAALILQNTTSGTLSDEHGRYRLNITRYLQSSDKPVLVVSEIGYIKKEIPLDPNWKGEVELNISLIPQKILPGTYFYVPRPTLWQRITRFLKRQWRKDPK